MADGKRRLLGLGLPFLAAFFLDTTLRLCSAVGVLGRELPVHPAGGHAFRPHALHLAPCGGGHWVCAMGGNYHDVAPAPAQGSRHCAFDCPAVFGHIAGAYSWWAQHIDRYLSVVFLLTGIGLGVGLHWYLKSSANSGMKQRAQRPFASVLRWGAIVTLSAMGYCLFVIG